MRKLSKDTVVYCLLLPTVAGGLLLYAEQRAIQRENLCKKEIAAHLKLQKGDPSWHEIEDRIDDAVSTQELHARMAKKWYRQFLQPTVGNPATGLPMGTIH